MNSLWKYVCYRFSVDVCLLQILCGSKFVIDSLKKVCLLQILCQGMFVTDRFSVKLFFLQIFC